MSTTNPLLTRTYLTSLLLSLTLLINGCAPSAHNTASASLEPATEAERLLNRKAREGKPVWPDGDTLHTIFIIRA